MTTVKFNELDKKRKEIDDNISHFINILDSNNVNHSTSLLDSQGFPRSDIDIPSVTIARSELAKLRNDRKFINDELSKELEFIHSSGSGTLSQPINPKNHLKPWAKVGFIANGSPAQTSGLQTNDLVITFGVFTHLTQDNFKRLPEYAQSKLNKSIEVIVNRNNEDQQIKLHLIPSNDWNGRGILGLQLNPIS